MKSSVLRFILVIVALCGLVVTNDSASGVSEPDYNKYGTLPTDQLMHPPEFRKPKSSKAFFSSIRSCMKKNGFSYRKPTAKESDELRLGKPIFPSMSQQAQKRWVDDYVASVANLLKKLQSSEQRGSLNAAVWETRISVMTFVDQDITDEQRIPYYSALHGCYFAELYPPVTLRNDIPAKVWTAADVLNDALTRSNSSVGLGSFYSKCSYYPYGLNPLDPSAKLTKDPLNAEKIEISTSLDEDLKEVFEGRVLDDPDVVLEKARRLGQIELECDRMFRQFEIETNRKMGLLESPSKSGSFSKSKLEFHFPSSDEDLKPPKAEDSSRGNLRKENNLGIFIFRNTFAGLTCDQYADNLSQLLAGAASFTSAKGVHDYFARHLINVDIDYGWKIEFHEPATYDQMNGTNVQSARTFASTEVTASIDSWKGIERNLKLIPPIDAPCDADQIYKVMRRNLTDDVILRLTNPPLNRRSIPLADSLRVLRSSAEF